ncbi:MAG: hypothetical protein IJQ82_15550 [Selenomonadaceae bacterium]|nr:hypothetical protein [Selenomonadaceae bacterium]
MADKDKFADEVMSEDELYNVAGGTIAETAADSFDLYRRGLTDKIFVGSERTRRVINFKGNKYQDHGGLFKPNEYYDKLGNPTTRENFWKEFDMQNQTEAVPVSDVIKEKLAPKENPVLVGGLVLCPV